MRHLKWWPVLIALFSINTLGAKERQIEVSVLNALLPSAGYDDNDSIEAVLTGDLPNPCFSLGEATVERVGQRFHVRQYAWMRTDGICGSGDLIEDPVPFATDVNLGKLSQGSYQLVFNPNADTDGSGDRNRLFSVDFAPVARVDTFTYAATTNATVSDYHKAGDTVLFALSGSLSSRCVRLKEPVKVNQVDDVFVVLPVIERVEGRDCGSARHSFQTQIDLGTPKPGEYLIHIRSRNGKAINRVFTVQNPTASARQALHR
jgi:hypothetical protein